MTLGVALDTPSWLHGSIEDIETFSRDLDVTPWDDVALDDRDAFGAYLVSLGLSEEFVRDALAVRDEGAAKMAKAYEGLKPYEGVAFFQSPPEYVEAQHNYRVARQSALQRFRDWWLERTRVIESTEPMPVRVPLFILGAPAVDGCRAEWKNEITTGFSDGWSLQIAGSGFTSDRGSTYVSSANFEASSGETKLIFCDIVLQVQNIEIRQPGREPVRDWRIDLSAVRGETEVGILLLDSGAVPPVGDYIRTYPLAGDATTASSTYSRRYRQEEATGVAVGLTVKGIQLGLSASSIFGNSVEITYTLRGGIDYPLFRARNCNGYLFGPSPVGRSG